MRINDVNWTNLVNLFAITVMYRKPHRLSASSPKIPKAADSSGSSVGKQVRWLDCLRNLPNFLQRLTFSDSKGDTSNDLRPIEDLL